MSSLADRADSYLETAQKIKERINELEKQSETLELRCRICALQDEYYALLCVYRRLKQ